MSHQMENINTNIYIKMKKNQMEILTLKCTVKYNNWNRNSLTGLNTRFELAEERISKLEDRSIESIQGEEQREKGKEKMKKVSENCVATLMYQHMHNGRTRGEERAKGEEKNIWRNSI